MKLITNLRVVNKSVCKFYNLYTILTKKVKIMTNIGMILKIIRVKNDENLQEMAKKLNCSSSYLSFIENGKRKVPGDFYDNVIKNYDLSDDEKKRIKGSLFF